MTTVELVTGERELGAVDRRRAARADAGLAGWLGADELAAVRAVFRQPVSDEELEQAFAEAGL